MVNLIDGLGSRELLLAAGALLGVMLANAAALLSVMICSATLGHRLERDARDELYRSLLGKSQTFHNRQRTGDLVARATDDTRLVNEMINPGIVYLTDLPIGFVVTLTYVALIAPRLAVVPALYGLAFTAAVRDHMRRGSPALAEQRTWYGRLAAVAEEVITGIEVVKATVREAWERQRFHRAAGVFRDLLDRTRHPRAAAADRRPLRRAVQRLLPPPEPGIRPDRPRPRRGSLSVTSRW